MTIINKMPPIVRITTTQFDGPKGHEVGTFDETYPLRTSEVQRISSTQLEVKLMELLAQARFSGLDVEVGKERYPEAGMGGYIPHVRISPNYTQVRMKMAQVSAPAEAGDTTPPATGTPEERREYFTMPSYIIERKPAVTGTYVPTGTSPLHDE